MRKKESQSWFGLLRVGVKFDAITKIVVFNVLCNEYCRRQPELDKLAFAGGLCLK